MDQEMDELKAEHLKKCLLIGELHYRRQMDELMINQIIKDLKLINERAASLKPKEEING